MVFYQSFLGEAPEAFKAVDVGVATCVDFVAVIYLKVPVKQLDQPEPMSTGKINKIEPSS